MGQLYELTEKHCTGWVEDLLKSLERGGILRKVETRSASCSPVLAAPYGVSEPVTGDPYKELAKSLNPYFGNGMPIESNIESMAKSNLGVCEDRKEWKKNLAAAVKEYGHDEILNSFYEWTLAYSGKFMGRKPVTMFLKTVGQNLATQKPSVSNKSLDLAEKGIAILTDNKVFFTGDYRIKLAKLLNEHGLNPVSQAFAEFWATVDDKQSQWSSREFLMRADVMIHTIKARDEQARQQAALVTDAYQQAKNNVEELQEEDEEL